jgi:DNA (cytosine-5)-methyltransferase 1
MRHGSLFSGIGGFDLAAEWMGWENVFHCEWNPFGQKVLKHYWPKAISYSDITKTDFKVHENTIDIISGGFPCQPYSTAGKRKGKEDERHLWPEMLRAIREIQPRWVVGENVRGLTNWNGGMVFDEVQADLEAEGYETLPFLLPACAVNAPHRRDRIWIIAHRFSNGLQRADQPKKIDNRGLQKGMEERYELNALHGNGNAAYTNVQQCKEWINEGKQENREEIRTGMEYRFTGLGGSDESGWKQFPTELPVCSRNDGIPAGLDRSTLSATKWRIESIKAFGNSAVPQVVFEIFKAIQHNDDSRTEP